MSATGVIVRQSCSDLNKRDGPSLTIAGRDEDNVAFLEGAELVFTDRPIDDDNISFLRLPYDIWKKIFRYSGVICPCHIALLPVRHGDRKTTRKKTRRKRFCEDLMPRPDLVTCALRKVREFDGDCADNHRVPTSMLGVSRMAKFITLKALMQEGSFHFELRDTTDVDGLGRTLPGFADMPPLNRELKRLHVNLFSKPKASDFLPIWYYFCDYFGKHLKGTLTHFGLECRPRTVEIAEEITASKAISNLKGLVKCNVLFDSLAWRPDRDLLRHYFQLSEQFVHGVVGFATTEAFRFMDLPTEIQMIILQYALVRDEVLHRGPRSWITSVPTQGVGNGDNGHIHSCCMCSMLKHGKVLTANTACSCLRRRSRALGIMLKSDRLPFVDRSPVPIFLTNKHIHALGSSIFYSKNKFEFTTAQLFRLRRREISYSQNMSEFETIPLFEFWDREMSIGFHTRYIECVRHLSIELGNDNWYYAYYPSDDSEDPKEYKRLATHLKNTFERASVDLTLNEWWRDKANPQLRDEVLSFFDHFEGERPEFYRRRKK